MAAAYEIEDRRKRPLNVFGSGQFILWEVRAGPIPYRVFAGKFATRKAAKERIAEIKAKGA